MFSRIADSVSHFPVFAVAPTAASCVRRVTAAAAMGAYLSEPLTEKHSQDEEDGRFKVGASSMQGWRVSQEDDHNAILDYGEKSAYFAVYDGHGGHEVAKYVADKLPSFIQNRKDFSFGADDDAMTKTLQDAFVSFDATLIERPVVNELKRIAGVKELEDEDEEDPEEVSNLYEEATMSMEEVIQKYEAREEAETELEKKFVPEGANTMKGKPMPKGWARAMEEEGSSKLVSPFLKGKRESKLNKENEPDTATTIDSRKKEDVKTEENGEGETKKDVEEVKKADVEKKVETEEVKEEKEETKVNGHETENGDKNGSAVDEEDAAPATKGKGKGKGKGKSSTVKSPTSEAVEEVATPKESPKPKVRKSATELYHSLVKEDEATDDESDEDDEDENYGDMDSDSDDDDGDDEDVEPRPDENDSDEPTTEEEDEEEDDEQETIGGEFNEEPGNDSGCTAVVAFLRGQDLFVANAGDSRCVVCRDGKAVEMSFDHKPEDEPEKERINKAGGKVTMDGRVNGGLNLSRALGDHAYKKNKSLPLTEQMISPVPDVRTLRIEPATDPFMVLACDGIWNSMSSQEVIDFVAVRIAKQPLKISSICEELFDYCLSPDTTGDGTGCDNMTAVIVQFKKDGAEATKVNGNGSAAASAEKELTQQSSKRKESEGKDGAKASEEPESKKAKL